MGCSCSGENRPEESVSIANGEAKVVMETAGEVEKVEKIEGEVSEPRASAEGSKVEAHEEATSALPVEAKEEASSALPVEAKEEASSALPVEAKEEASSALSVETKEEAASALPVEAKEEASSALPAEAKKEASSDLPLERDPKYVFTIIFNKSPLGIILTSNNNGICAYVTGVDAEKNEALMDNKLPLNSKLLKLNDSHVELDNIDTILEKIMAKKMPIELTFCHPDGLNDDEAASSPNEDIVK